MHIATLSCREEICVHTMLNVADALIDDRMVSHSKHKDECSLLLSRSGWHPLNPAVMIDNIPLLAAAP